MLKFLLAFLFFSPAPFHLSPETSRLVISGDDLTPIIETQVPVADADLWITDRFFSLLDYRSLQNVLTDNRVNGFRYSQEIFDCDDFAAVMKGRVSDWARKEPSLAYAVPVGTLFCSLKINGQVYYHALNITVDANKKVWIYEPQADRLFDPKEVPFQKILLIVF